MDDPIMTLLHTAIAAIMLAIFGYILKMNRCLGRLEAGKKDK